MARPPDDGQAAARRPQHDGTDTRAGRSGRQSGRTPGSADMFAAVEQRTQALANYVREKAQDQPFLTMAAGAAAPATCSVGRLTLRLTGPNRPLARSASPLRWHALHGRSAVASHARSS